MGYSQVESPQEIAGERIRHGLRRPAVATRLFGLFEIVLESGGLKAEKLDLPAASGGGVFPELSLEVLRDPAQAHPV